MILTVVAATKIRNGVSVLDNVELLCHVHILLRYCLAVNLLCREV
jgi:hypothetical protein